jgi:hypothetical protein
MILPALATTWAVLARPPSRLLVGLAAATVVIELPAAFLLAGAGGVECPRGCSTEQDLLQGLCFLGLPLTLICLLVAAGLSGRRRGRL